MKKIFALLMVLVMAFAFGACAKKSGVSTPDAPKTTSIVGGWESTKVEYMGETLTGEDAAGFEFILEDGGNGKCIIDGEETGSVEWSENGGAVKIVVEGVMTFEGTLAGSNLVFDDFMGQDMKVTFTKK